MSPWERRQRGGLYYTRSHKEGGRVVREYIGSGPLAELAAKTDDLRRLRREKKAKTWREERESLEALDRDLGELYETAEILAKAALLAAGYHQHHRSEWRKRRVDKKRPKNTYGQGAAVPARRASTPNKGPEVTRSHSELLDELRTLTSLTHEGDGEAPRRIRRALEETPNSAQILSNIVAKKAERLFVGRICGDDLLLKEALSLQLQAIRKEVAGLAPSPLERLLAERVVACWLQLQQAEAAYAVSLGKLTPSQDEYHQRRLDRLHRRYLAAIRSLAQVRKLLTPAVTQIYVAEQQVNVAAEHLRGDS